jgi:subtilase family serine protease
MHGTSWRWLNVVFTAAGIIVIALASFFGTSLLLSTNIFGASIPKTVSTTTTPTANTMRMNSANAQGMPPNGGITPMRPRMKAAQKMGQGETVMQCLKSTALPRCYTPQQLQRAYGIQPLLQAGITGQGRIITLIEAFQDPSIKSDLHIFDQLFGLNDPQLNVFTPFGTTAFNPKDAVQTGFAGETALDVEWAHAMAPGATIDVIEGNVKNPSAQGQLSALLQATNYAVQNNIGSVISQSFGASEQCLGTTFIQQAHAIFQQARNQKQTVIASAGDMGTAVIQCDNAGNIISLAGGVNYPASDPLVTSVGGTTLQTDANGTYQTESTWNDTQDNMGATGGGNSQIFQLPPFQQGSVNSQSRGVNDISFDADPMSGVPVVTSSLMPGETVLVPVGGTSLGAPAFAGMVALFDQAAGNRRLGYLNSALYRIAQNANLYAQNFHDITQGNNTFLFQNGNGQNTQVQQITGFDSRTGWDAPTGLGTPIANTLVTLLPQFIRTGDGANL